MRRGKRTLPIFICVLLLALSACASGQDAVSESPAEESGAEADYQAAVKRNADLNATKIIRLGSSPYAIRISREFHPMRVSNENWEDDVVAGYRNDDKLLDFYIYQFSKEGYPDTLAEFTEQEAEEYDATEVATEGLLNGIPVGRYRAIDEYGGVYRDGVTYVMENRDEYIEVDFWFIGYQAEEEMRKIMDTLTAIESDVLPLGAYLIRVPNDLTLVSGAGANPAVYKSANASLALYVSRFPAGNASLMDFVLSEVLRKGASDIETDAEINGIPVAFYRAVEAFDGAFHNTLTCALDDGGGFTALTFRLDGITAETEALAILETLSESPET